MLQSLEVACSCVAFVLGKKACNLGLAIIQERTCPYNRRQAKVKTPGMLVSMVTSEFVEGKEDGRVTLLFLIID